MKVSRDERLTKPYVLEATDLEVLCNRLQKWFASFSFEITSKDSLKREFSTLDGLLQFENAPSKDIQTLRISGYSKDLQTRIWLKFDKGLTRNVYVVIEGDEESATDISEIVEDRLAAMRPWYSVLAKSNFIPVVVFNWMVLFLVLTLIRKISHQVQPNFSLSLTVLIIISTIVGIVSALIFNFSKQAVFPMGVFALGQGAKRHKDKDIIRTGVIIAFLVSLVSSVIASLMLSQ